MLEGGHTDVLRWIFTYVAKQAVVAHPVENGSVRILQSIARCFLEGFAFWFPVSAHLSILDQRPEWASRMFVLMSLISFS